MYTEKMITSAAIGISAARRVLTHDISSVIIFGANATSLATGFELKDKGIERVMIADLSTLHLGIAEQAGFDTCCISEENAEKEICLFFGLYSQEDRVQIENEGAKKLIEIWNDMHQMFVSVAVAACCDETAWLYSDKPVFWVRYIKETDDFTESDMSDALNLVREKFPYFHAVM